MSDVISLYSPNWEPYSSYGIESMHLLYHLSEMGVHVNSFSVLNGQGQTQMKWPEQAEIIHRLLENEFKPSLGGFALGYPTFFEDYGEMLTAGPMVCLTHWESTKMPPGWLEALNRPNMKAVVVGATWVKAMMEKEGVKPPIHVVPLGISEVYQYYKRPARKMYRFLCFGDRYTRKGWDVVVRAFAMKFAGRDDVELIIKTRKTEGGPSLVYPLGDGLMTWGGQRFEYMGKSVENVRILDEDLDEFELNDLYRSVDCMVFPSRGEGFGIPPREFAATGGVSIVNKWWADDVEAWAYPVNYTMVPAWQGHREFGGLGEWAEPDVDHLAEQMAYVENLERTNIRYARYIGEQSARRVRKLYNWQKFAARCWEIWQAAPPAPPLTLEEKRARRKARKNNGHHRTAHGI